MRPPPPPPSAARRSAKSKSGSTSTAKTPVCSKQRLKRGPWTPDEDELLSNCVTKEGEGRWRTLPKRAGLLRCGKSCRLRWMNYLRPDVKRGHIAPDEEDLILRLHRLLGNRWSLIAGRIPGRTDNEIKNYWNTHLSKKLISQGIDPRTHKPLSSSTIDHFQQHNNHIGSSSSAAAALECSSNRIPPPVPKVNWSFNWSVTEEEEEEEAAADGSGKLQDCQVVAGFGNNIIIGEGEKEEDGFNYACTDEVFSSFLNSLINEDDVLLFNEIGAAATATAMPSTAYSDTNNNNVMISAAAPSSTQNDPLHEFS